MQEEQVIETTVQETDVAQPEVAAAAPEASVVTEVADVWGAWEPQWTELEPEPYRPDPAYVDSIKQFAVDNKLTPKEAQDLLNLQVQRAAEIDKSWEAKELAEAEQLKNNLKQEWGEQFEQRLQRVANVSKQFGGEEVQNLVMNTWFGANEQVVRFLDNVAEAMQSPKFFGSGAGSAAPTQHKTMSEAWQAAVMQDSKLGEGIMNVTHPDNKRAVQVWNELARKYQ